MTSPSPEPAPPAAGRTSPPPLPFERVDPATSCLLVVDVQNDFVAGGGWFDRNGQTLGEMREAVERLLPFLEAARVVGLAPTFVQAIYDEKWLSVPMLERHRNVGLGIEHCMEGTWGADFFRVGPKPGEDLIVKHRYSPFFDTGLELLLRTRRVENVIVTGVTTNVCVEAAARDAYMRDFHVVVVSDCTATYAPAPHEASLDTIRRAFGRVATSQQIVRLWKGLKAASA